MTPERWRQIEQVIQQALDLQPDERDAFLQNTCTGNDDLRLEVNSFLAMQRSAHHFLEKPAIFQAAHEFGTHDTASWIGRRVGPYEVLSVLGIGGMGEVYRACDMRLKRDVAIKVLPVPFTTDPERLSRFRREAEVLASLNHPHIAAIYDVADFAENTFLVLEFVE